MPGKVFAVLAWLGLAGGIVYARYAKEKRELDALTKELLHQLDPKPIEEALPSKGEEISGVRPPEGERAASAQAAAGTALEQVGRVP